MKIVEIIKLESMYKVVLFFTGSVDRACLTSPPASHDQRLLTLENLPEESCSTAGSMQSNPVVTGPHAQREQRTLANLDGQLDSAGSCSDYSSESDYPINCRTIIYGSSCGGSDSDESVLGCVDGQTDDKPSSFTRQLRSRSSSSSLPRPARTPVAEEGTFRCQKCKRFYRTKESCDKHYKACNFEVSTSEEEEEDDEFGNTGNTLDSRLKDYPLRNRSLSDSPIVTKGDNSPVITKTTECSNVAKPKETDQPLIVKRSRGRPLKCQPSVDINPGNNKTSASLAITVPINMNPYVSLIPCLSPTLVVRATGTGDCVTTSNKHEPTVGVPPEPAKVEPAGDSPQPAGDAPQPAGDVPQPAGDAPQPAGDAPQPAGDAPQPAGDAPQAKTELKPVQNADAIVVTISSESEPDEPSEMKSKLRKYTTHRHSGRSRTKFSSLGHISKSVSSISTVIPTTANTPANNMQSDSSGTSSLSSVITPVSRTVFTTKSDAGTSESPQLGSTKVPQMVMREITSTNKVVTPMVSPQISSMSVTATPVVSTPMASSPFASSPVSVIANTTASLSAAPAIVTATTTTVVITKPTPVTISLSASGCTTLPVARFTSIPVQTSATASAARSLLQLSNNQPTPASSTTGTTLVKDVRSSTSSPQTTHSIKPDTSSQDNKEMKQMSQQNIMKVQVSTDSSGKVTHYRTSSGNANQQIVTAHQLGDNRVKYTVTEGTKQDSIEVSGPSRAIGNAPKVLTSDGRVMYQVEESSSKLSHTNTVHSKLYVPEVANNPNFAVHQQAPRQAHQLRGSAFPGAQTIRATLAGKLSAMASPQTTTTTVRQTIEQMIKHHASKPTSTALPTQSARPTSTALPTQSARPTSTALPTQSARPTSTALPTQSARPTSTAFPTQSGFRTPAASQPVTVTATRLHGTPSSINSSLATGMGTSRAGFTAPGSSQSGNLSGFRAPGPSQPGSLMTSKPSGTPSSVISSMVQSRVAPINTTDIKDPKHNKTPASIAAKQPGRHVKVVSVSPMNIEKLKSDQSVPVKMCTTFASILPKSTSSSTRSDGKMVSPNKPIFGSRSTSTHGPVAQAVVQPIVQQAQSIMQGQTVRGLDPGLVQIQQQQPGTLRALHSPPAAYNLAGSVVAPGQELMQQQLLTGAGQILGGAQQQLTQVQQIIGSSTYISNVGLNTSPPNQNMASLLAAQPGLVQQIQQVQQINPGMMAQGIITHGASPTVINQGPNQTILTQTGSPPQIISQIASPLLNQSGITGLAPGTVLASQSLLQPQVQQQVIVSNPGTNLLSSMTMAQPVGMATAMATTGGVNQAGFYQQLGAQDATVLGGLNQGIGAGMSQQYVTAQGVNIIGSSPQTVNLPTVVSIPQQQPYSAVYSQSYVPTTTMMSGHQQMVYSRATAVSSTVTPPAHRQHPNLHQALLPKASQATSSQSMQKQIELIAQSKQAVTDVAKTMAGSDQPLTVTIDTHSKDATVASVLKSLQAQIKHSTQLPSADGKDKEVIQRSESPAGSKASNMDLQMLCEQIKKQSASMAKEGRHVKISGKVDEQGVTRFTITATKRARPKLVTKSPPMLQSGNPAIIKPKCVMDIPSGSAVPSSRYAQGMIRKTSLELALEKSQQQAATQKPVATTSSTTSNPQSVTDKSTHMNLLKKAMMIKQKSLYHSGQKRRRDEALELVKPKKFKSYHERLSEFSTQQALQHHKVVDDDKQRKALHAATMLKSKVLNTVQSLQKTSSFKYMHDHNVTAKQEAKQMSKKQKKSRKENLAHVIRKDMSGKFFLR